MEPIGERIRVLRETRGWSQGALAKRAGVSRSYIALLETGQRINPRAHKLAAFAKAFELSSDELLGIGAQAWPAAGARMQEVVVRADDLDEVGRGLLRALLAYLHQQGSPRRGRKAKNEGAMRAVD